MPSSKHTNYACHRLIDECGKVHASSVIALDEATGHVVAHSPFTNDEVPFTQWIGGTILLTHETKAPLTQGQCLNDYLHQGTKLPEKAAPSSSPLYAWHTPLVDTAVPLSYPPTLLPSPFTRS